jgi:transposase
VDIKKKDGLQQCDCGNVMDRDYNASVNISRSINYTTKSERKSNKKIDHFSSWE